MLRFILGLLIICLSVTPAAAFAQTVNTAANETADAVDTTTNATVNTTQTTNTTETSNVSNSSSDQPRDLDRTPLEASGNALLMLFVLAVVLESALALLFNWRPFVARYDGRGIKAPISLFAAGALVFAFRPDAVASLMEGYGAQVGDAGRLFARVIEAMVIAGGSAGVNRMLIALGFRSQLRAQEVVARPKHNEAWISVGLIREKAQGPVYVAVKEGTAAEEIAGTISGTRAEKRSYFRRDNGRLPQAGGLGLPPGKEISVALVDMEGNRSDTWGPHRLKAGAIVDIDLEL